MDPNSNSAPEKAPTSETPATPVEPTNISKPDTASNDVQLADKTARSSKPLTWVFAILAIIGITAAAVFAYLYFTTPTSSPVPNDSQSTNISDDPSVEETEITDTLLKKDLNEKFNILHDTNETGLLIKKSGINYYYISRLYENGTLSEIARLVHIAKSLPWRRSIGYDEMQSIISEQGYDELNASAFRESNNIAIEGEIIAAKYLDIFGKPLDKGAANGENYCPGIYYNSTYDFYYDPVLGCGGTNPYYGLFHKNKYTVDAEHAYVYVYTGTYNAEDNKIYCDIIKVAPEATYPAVCGEAEEASDFTIDETNYQNFAKYRFVFNKADDGTYYFSKVEKL